MNQIWEVWDGGFGEAGPEGCGRHVAGEGVGCQGGGGAEGARGVPGRVVSRMRPPTRRE